MRKIIVFFIIFNLFGCTYHGSLGNDLFHQQNYIAEKINCNFYVSEDFLNQKRDFRTVGGFGDKYIINFKNGVFNAVNESMKTIFVNGFIKTPSESKKSLLIKINFYIDPKHIGNWSGLHIYEMKINIDIISDKLIKNYEDKRTIFVTPTTKIKLLGNITSASLYLLSPITVPIITNLSGEHGLSIIEKNLNESLNLIIKKINDERIDFDFCGKISDPT